MIEEILRGRPRPTSSHRPAALLISTLLTCLLAGPAFAASAPETTGAGPASASATPAEASVSSVSVPTSATAASPAAGTATSATTALTMTTSATAAAMATDLLRWLNRDRVASGLRPVRSWPAIASLAAQRSANMAASYTLSHQAAGGDPGNALTARGLQWYGFGEIIGETSYNWGYAAAANLYSMWKGSPVHHAIMFSATYNYVGVGIARAANGSTWSSILFVESVDHTPPTARNGALSVSGTTVHFSWSGADPLLQTHTAGLRGFDVMYRVDEGAWHLVRNDTTSTAVSLGSRPPGHYYSYQVRSRDRRGNLSAWTPVKRIWLP